MRSAFETYYAQHAEAGADAEYLPPIQAVARYVVVPGLVRHRDTSRGHV
jgi:hypothetical protein